MSGKYQDDRSAEQRGTAGVGHRRADLSVHSFEWRERGMHAIWLETDLAWPDDSARPRYSMRALKTLPALLRQRRP